nr:hypothetical protein [Tanacetum cinerariifolium]
QSLLAAQRAGSEAARGGGSVIFAFMNTNAVTAYLELNPQVRFGKLGAKFMRTTVAEMLANGLSVANITEDFSAIGAAQVRACLL